MSVYRCMLMRYAGERNRCLKRVEEFEILIMESWRLS